MRTNQIGASRKSDALSSIVAIKRLLSKWKGATRRGSHREMFHKNRYSANRSSTIELLHKCGQNPWKRHLKEFILDKVAGTSLKVTLLHWQFSRTLTKVQNSFFVEHLPH